MFTQTNVPIPGLLDGYESALTEMGYSMTTKLLFIRRADLIIRQHMNKGLEYLDRDTICAYTREIDGKYFNGGMQRRHYERTRREIDRFVAYAFSGIQTLLPSPLRGASRSLRGLWLSSCLETPTRTRDVTCAGRPLNILHGWKTRALKIWRVSALSRYRSSFWIVRRNMLRALSMTSSCI